MLIGDIRTMGLYVDYKLITGLIEVFLQFLIIALCGITVPLVLSVTLCSVKFIPSLVGIGVFLSSQHVVETCNHTDSTKTVLHVHVVNLVAKHSQIHGTRITHAIHKGNHLLAL